MFESSAFSPALLVRFNPSVPDPVPVFAVTVHTVPLPVTPEIDGPVNPTFANVKFDEVSPVTEALNSISQLTDAALVGFKPDLSIEAMVF
jgi:hypothetical protein